MCRVCLRFFRGLHGEAVLTDSGQSVSDLSLGTAAGDTQVFSQNSVWTCVPEDRGRERGAERMDI